MREDVTNVEHLKFALINVEKILLGLFISIGIRQLHKPINLIQDWIQYLRKGSNFYFGIVYIMYYLYSFTA